MSLVETTATDLTADEARAVTDRIRQTSEIVWAQIIKAYRGRAWLALGYSSWDQYLDAELGDIRVQLPREARREVVASLSEAGMSTRAIAAATGVNFATVSRDLTGVANATPDPSPSGDDDDREASMPGESHEHSDPGQVTSPEGHPDDDIVDAEIVDEPAHTVTGLDGKTYAKPKPTKPRRGALGDSANNAGWKLRAAVERLERIFADDRFGANKEQVATHTRGHLTYAARVCQDLLGRLDH